MTKQLYCSIKEAAAMFSVSQATIYRRIQKGELPLYKCGKSSRVKIEEAEAVLMVPA